MRRKGFTLVELLIVIVVIGILSAMMMLSSNEAVSSAKANNVISNLRNLKTATLAWYADHIDWVHPSGNIQLGSRTEPIQQFAESDLGIKKYMNNEDSVKLNSNAGANQKIPDGEYGVYAVRGTTQISGQTDRNKWYVGYKIPGKESRVKEKLAGRAKSLGLHFTSDYPGAESDGYYVWLLVKE